MLRKEGLRTQKTKQGGEEKFGKEGRNEGGREAGTEGNHSRLTASRDNLEEATASVFIQTLTPWGLKRQLYK